jgi:hypothetical protein
MAAAPESDEAPFLGVHLDVHDRDGAASAAHGGRAAVFGVHGNNAIPLRGQFNPNDH